MPFLLALLLAAAEPTVPTADPAIVADSPEEIAKDSARDLKDNRYYNKPGATRADYDADWQKCRLIARGSITPGGVPTVIVYNPAIISPVAAGAGGLIGGLIAGAIAEGEQRRANRRSCLMIKGWRLVEVDADQAAKFAALPDAEREIVFNKALGDPDPKGKRIIRWTNQFAAPVLAPETGK